SWHFSESRHELSLNWNTSSTEGFCVREFFGATRGSNPSDHMLSSPKSWKGANASKEKWPRRSWSLERTACWARPSRRGDGRVGATENPPITREPARQG